ncbi:hypothetical protein DFR70_103159 [Nocardia tenerifensis]|uniref:Uncharacterized protein n=1 Tax=Nocardia tenerifensis TaxID=228006 RepID=A0A318K3K9_9NOCA|nr:hypothetical protein [Nocardia tenerifensis]PXX66411.1 hypothetical protein DFR70_103159 [Nocardia tenerifensis]
MTSVQIDRRVSTLETRVTDVEELYGECQLELTRRVTGLEIWAGRTTAQGNGIGRSLSLIMERLGIPPTEIAEVAMPTEAEIDAALEAGC